MWKRSTRLLKCARGMSMLELLAVVTMSLIMGSVAVPKIVKTFQRHRLSATARDLATTVQAARFVAILRQGTYGVQINNTNHTLEVVQWNGSSWQNMTLTSGTNPTYDAFANRKSFNPNVTITTSGMGTGNVVAFNEKGELLNSSGSSPSAYSSGGTMPTITVTTPAGSRDVVLTRFGNMKLMYHSTTNQM